MGYLSIITSFLGVSTKTLIIRGILLAIISGFSTYFYVDYNSMKKNSVELKATILNLEDALEKIDLDRINLEKYYKDSLLDCELTYTIISEKTEESKKDKIFLVKKISKAETISDFFNILREDD